MTEHFERGWNTVTNNQVALILGFVIALLVTGLSLFLLTGPMVCGYCYLATERMNGRDAGIDEIFREGFRYPLLSFMAISVPYLMIMIVGFLIGRYLNPLQPLVQLGQIGAGVLYFTWIGPVFVYTNNTGYFEIVEETLRFGTGSNRQIGFALLAVLISALGAVLCVVGFLVTTPLATVALLHFYATEQGHPISDPEDQEEEETQEVSVEETQEIAEKETREVDVEKKKTQDLSDHASPEDPASPDEEGEDDSGESDGDEDETQLGIEIDE